MTAAIISVIIIILGIALSFISTKNDKQRDEQAAASSISTERARLCRIHAAIANHYAKSCATMITLESAVAIANARCGKITVHQAYIEIDKRIEIWRLAQVEAVKAVLKIPDLDEDSKSRATILLIDLQEGRVSHSECASLNFYR